MVKKAKASGRGGRRKGAGRKPKHGEPTRKVSVMVPESLYEWAESQAGKTVSDVIIESMVKAKAKGE